MATQEDIDAATANIKSLNSAIGAGVRQATVDGQTVTYNTTESLIKARNDQMTLLASLQAQDAPAPRSRTVKLAYGGRGYQ